MNYNKNDPQGGSKTHTKSVKSKRGSLKYPRRSPCGSPDHQKGPQMDPQGVPVELCITNWVPKLVAPDCTQLSGGLERMSRTSIVS